ncbi:MAG TPA: PIN domain-containing protein [Candidatus Acidoferrum sp.]|nr:PIN domain-containing protein [Candidatus Acidoferrum sp.]
MKEFFDTSVLIAAFQRDHVHHAASLRRFAAATVGQSACAAHTLAEVYATMTAFPVRPMVSPEQTLLFIDEIRIRLKLISLTPQEYYDTIVSASDLKLLSGRIYDALILRSAQKSEAEAIYTLNLKHFQAIAPALSQKICMP